MTSLLPRDPYSEEELKKFYPTNLELKQVQLLFRHGERSPTSVRFQNAGLPKYWPYCSMARKMISPILETDNSNKQWTYLRWLRKIETFGKDDLAVLATSSQGEVDSLCKLGELTNLGRVTTYNLGQRLRHLYVDQLKFMPQTLEDTENVYLRATYFPRALESLQQVFQGMYPTQTRASSLGPLTIIIRNEKDENLFPNTPNCRRLSQLAKAFAQRSADNWNHTAEMKYLNKIIGKWMPENSKTVAVDSSPRLSGILDTINSTLAHGPETRLPDEFYDSYGREVIDKISVEECFRGYQESQEFRKLGIGSLMRDIVSRMISSVRYFENFEYPQYDNGEGDEQKRVQKKAIRFAMNGCHDTTLAAILASMGTFDGKPWPPYTSHIAIELFKRSPPPYLLKETSQNHTDLITQSAKTIQSHDEILSTPSKNTAGPKIHELNEKDHTNLDGYFVRLRYNDEVVIIPGCIKPGNHLHEDESFCTLVRIQLNLTA